jgi:diguanylate cyclase (GGDEF)-like protein
MEALRKTIMTRTWGRDLINLLPHGRSLPADTWRGRHRAIAQTTVVAVVLLFGFLLWHGWTLAHAISEAGFTAAFALVAYWTPFSKRMRASLIAVALMGIAAIAVHATGTIEAHFLFFIAVPIVALYEDWAPFATSAGMVLVHHVVVGLLDPASVYNHEAALAAPLRWALIHGALFLTMCVISIAHWRIHERARATLARQALHDDLTGLANRTLLLDRLEHALRDSTRTDEPVTVVALDIDGFKPINDTFGHSAGDALLVEIAARLRAAIRPGDTAARPGGDEFVVVLPGASPDDALETARRIIDAVSAPVTVGEETISVGASVGIAVATTIADKAETLLDRADAAMLTAKRNGRRTFVLYHAGLDQTGSESLPVFTSDARAWADYMTTLRDEIGERKASGEIPAQTRAPDSVHRTLSVLLAAIMQLPDDCDHADLPLPEQASLEEFFFHQTMVHDWADSLLDAGILTTERPRAADDFWANLQRRISPSPSLAM